MSGATYIQDLKVECRELLAEIARTLERFESGEASIDDVSLLRRCVHSIKGCAIFTGVDSIAAMAHETESALHDLPRRATSEQLVPVWRGHDRLSLAIETLREDGTHATLEAPPESESPPRTEAAATPATTTIGESPAEDPSSVNTPIAETPTAEPTESAEDVTLRVPLSKLDQLVNLSSELVLVRNQVQAALRDPAVRHSPALARVVRSLEQLNVITTDLSRAVMEARLVHVESLVADLPRQVRQLSARLNKAISCQVEGAKIELDKSVIDRLKHPLGHLLRNACDHGIEAPEVRIAAGKPEEGTISFRATQEESFVRILFADDGAGIDEEAIRTLAVERGLMDAAEAQHAPRERILALIFEPAFSSRREVTDTSGRGVGMDVVREEIEGLNGTLSLRSEPGVGTEFEIRLPVSLFVVPALKVGVEEHRLAIPTANVVEVVPATPDGPPLIEPGAQVVIRGQAYPIVDLAPALEVDRPRAEVSAAYWIVCHHLGRHCAVPVDDVENREDLVVRNLQGGLRNLVGIRGLSILGDGSVIPVLDIGYLLDAVGVTAARTLGS